MTSHTTKAFRRALAALPKLVQQQARQAYQQFRRNPHHPGLRFKKVHDHRPVYSVRISIEYRALGVVENDAMVWFWIGTHAEYDRIVQQL